MDISTKIKLLIQDTLQREGLKIYKITYQKEESNKVLRIVIEGENKLTADDCAAAYKKINPILEENNLIDEPHILEVSTRMSEEK
ncbi:MAG: hypothetical protein Q4G04_03100 [bacterium]|nr:hypothetical protein [bacterium]